MLLEPIELTINHVDLGNLNEFALTTLFGAAQAYRITAGKVGSIREIVDRDGNVLYPGYFMTHLRVPTTRLVSSFEPWKPLAVGVEHRIFGGMIMDSTYVVARKGELVDDVEKWDLKNYPSMSGGTIFVVDNNEAVHQPKTPRADKVADLPKLMAPPPSINKFTEVQGTGTLGRDASYKLRSDEPIQYLLVTGRDVAPGRNLMFASFIRLLDYGERILLTERLSPAFPPDVVDCLTILDRETYYLANCGANRTVRIDVRAKMSSVTPDIVLDKQANLSPGGVLDCCFEVYEEGSNRLLVVSRSRKLFAVPNSNKVVLKDLERLAKTHAI